MITYLVMDVDGTLTDGKIYLSGQEELFKVFDIKDGFGIHDLLPMVGITPVVITGRNSRIVTKRCNELGIKYVYQGCTDKKAKLIELAANFGLKPDQQGKYQEIAYIGDDLNDLECMNVCGMVGCPANAVEEVKKIATFVSAKNGGDGAVRNIIEEIVAIVSDTSVMKSEVRSGSLILC